MISPNPDIDIIRTGASECESGVFIQFRNGAVRYLDFDEWLPSDVAHFGVSVYTGYDEETQELVIPLSNGREHRIHALTLLVTQNLETRTRFEAEAPGYASKWGKAVRRARECRNWSQAELARRAGTLQCVISRLECGVNEPRVSTIDRMCRAFGISRYELLSGRDPAAPSNEDHDWFDELLDAVPELRIAGKQSDDTAPSDPTGPNDPTGWSR